MLGRSPFDAYRNFIEPVQRTLNTIAAGRLIIPIGKVKVAPGEPIDVYMNNGLPMPLHSTVLGKCTLHVAIRAQVEPLEFGSYSYQCLLRGYLYGFQTEDGQEILSYHWTPHAHEQERHYPHLHEGPAVSGDSLLADGRFHKLHNPTGILSSQQIVRFALQELGVSVRPGQVRDLVLADLNRQIGDA